MYTRNVNTKLKAAAFIVLAFLAVPFASFAQSPSRLAVTDIAYDSILVLSNEEQAFLDTFIKSTHLVVSDN